MKIIEIEANKKKHRQLRTKIKALRMNKMRRIIDNK